MTAKTVDADCDVSIADEDFRSEVAHFVGLKGFCVVGTGVSAAELTAARAEVQDLDSSDRFFAPPTLVVEGLLGPEGSTSIAELEPFIMDASERRDGPNLQKLDKLMSQVAGMIDEVLEPNFGFVCKERSVGLLHVANKFAEEEPTELTESRASKWLNIFKRHRLMFVMCLGTRGGSLMLRPLDADSQELMVPMKYGQMVILRADYLSHAYSGNTDKDLMLTCWVLQRDHLGARGAFAECRDGMPLVPAAQNLVEWATERLMMIRGAEESEKGTLADQEIPRAWKLMASHTVNQGVQCAIRGVGVNLPNKCENMSSYAGPMLNGTDFGIEIPFKRWDHFQEGPNWGGWYSPEPDVWRYNRFKTNIKHATFIEGQDLFDNKFFNMSLLESKVMDPNQRLVLENCYEALNMAGYTKKSLMQAFIGVYQGHTASDWDKIEHEVAGGCAGSYSPTIASNRVSFALGIMGPSFTIDLEGAASLASIYQGAHDVIPSGDWRKPPTTGSVCGGCTLNLASYWWPVHNQFMSMTGRSLTFDQSASGYIKGEGVATVVLKRHAEMVEGKVVLDESKPDIGILAGWSMVSSGQNAGLTAPSGPSQQRIMYDSVRVARISPLDVDAVEIHGAGNYIHDATETSCMAKSLRGVPGGDEEVIMCNSSKGKMGFCQETAGIAAFLSVLVSQRMGIVSPSIHCKIVNPYIQIEDYAVIIPTEATSFRTSSSFHGVTAYGFGGSNVHILLHTELDTARFTTPDIGLDRQVFAFWPGGGGELVDGIKSEKGYAITGSWLQWSSPQKMKAEGDGSYSYTLTLGPNCFEHFQILIDSDVSKTLHPGERDASSATMIYGPEEHIFCEGMNWLIDGRPQQVPMLAPPPEHEFNPHPGYLTGGDLLEKECTLEEAKEQCKRLPLCKGFCYEGKENVKGTVRVFFKSRFDLGEASGWTSYSIDTKPVETAALGYYEMSGRDAGAPGDVYKIKLQIAGKWKTVVWDKIGTGEALEDDGAYYFCANFNDWELAKMQKDSSIPGLFKLDVTLPGTRYSPFVNAEFQIVRNQDWGQSFFPADALSASGKAEDVAGPGEGNGLGWILMGNPGETFRIEFERLFEDGKETKKVTWQKLLQVKN